MYISVWGQRPMWESPCTILHNFWDKVSHQTCCYWLDWLAVSFGIFLLSYPVQQLEMFRPAMSGFLSGFWRSELKPSCLCSLVRYWLELTPLDNFFMANPYRQILGGANAVLLPGIGDNGFWFLWPFIGGRWTVVSVASLCRKEGADDGR